ncbi:hypothetical protein PR048_001197 [Dryococelus australis]|uniref:Uncharacterized protein n=1 Tax=Dryococelus australis TaxID=614101 RepID=A0ABQ9IGS1_9NEOP|nr:hypothetical protein PR048_001197 [Dryococelus australis]
MYDRQLRMIQTRQPDDIQHICYTYAVQICQLDTKQHDFKHRLIMSEESHFHLNGCINKENFRTWATEYLRAMHQRPKTIASPKMHI